MKIYYYFFYSFCRYSKIVGYKTDFIFQSFIIISSLISVVLFSGIIVLFGKNFIKENLFFTVAIPVLISAILNYFLFIYQNKGEIIFNDLELEYSNKKGIKFFDSIVGIVTVLLYISMFYLIQVASKK